MPMMPTYDFETEADAIKRKQAIADAMQQSALAPLQLPTQSGVKLSGVNVLAKLLEGYVAGKKADEAKSERAALSQRYGDELKSGMEQYYKTMQGYEAPSMALTPNEDGTPQMVKVPGDRKKAIFDALASNHPVLRDLAMQQLKEEGKSQLTPKDLLAISTPESVLANTNNPAAWKPKRELKAVAPGEVLLDSSGNFATPGNPGGTPPWQTTRIAGDLYQQSATGLKKLDNAPKVNVNASPVIMGQRAGTQEYFKNAAQQVGDMGKQANASQQLLHTLNTLEQLHKAGINSNITSGAATALQNFAQQMGVQVDSARLANTEAYNSLITDLWQRSVAQYGGNRGVTQSEAEEIKKLTPLTSTSSQAREQLFALQRNAAIRNIEAYKQANKSFAQAAAADDPRLFQIPDYIQGSYIPPAGNAANPTTALPAGGNAPKRLRWEDMQ